MSKAREFWIKDNEVHEEKHKDMMPYDLHVIEKSAYDNLKSDFDSILKESDMDCTEALFNERTAWSAADKMATAIERALEKPKSHEAVRILSTALSDYRGEK